MPEVTLTFTTAQVTRAKAAIRKRNPDSNKSDGQLLKQFIRERIAIMVESGDRNEEEGKIKIKEF